MTPWLKTLHCSHNKSPAPHLGPVMQLPQYCSDLFSHPLSPHSLQPSHACLSAEPETGQAYLCLRALAQATPTAWDTIPSAFVLMAGFSASRSQFKSHLIRQAFSAHQNSPQHCLIHIPPCIIIFITLVTRRFFSCVYCPPPRIQMPDL